MDRRGFLHGAGLGVSSLLVGGQALAGGVGLLERTSRPTNYEAPRGGFSERITALEDFYVRSHFDAPTIDAGRYAFVLDGLTAATPLKLSLADLQGMPQTTVEAVLQCAGNGRALFAPRMPGVQWERGAMGNARWTGVRLKTLLERAGVRLKTGHLHLRGADGPMLPTTPAFIRAVPLSKAWHEDTLVALTMNGAPLPKLHGGPARLVMPGWVADGWTKWAHHLTVADVEPMGFYWEKAYRFPTTPIKPGEVPKAKAPMTTMNVKSLIATPTGDAPLTVGVHEIVGVAFSGGDGISRVDVRINDGPWQKATVDGGGSRYGFHVFRAPFSPKAPGTYRLTSRATDDVGRTQPERPAWNPSGYLFNALDPHVVEVRA